MLKDTVKVKTREMLLKEISQRAPYYTQEWRYNPDSPDAGTALAFIWADMLSDTYERFSRLPDNFRRALLDAIGSEPRPALKAGGYLVFNPLPEAVEDILVPAGTGVASPKNIGAALLTDRDLAVSSCRVEEVFYADPVRDMIVRYGRPCDITLFKADEAGEHIWTLSHPYAFDLSETARLRLEFDLHGGGIEALERAVWEFQDGDMWYAFKSVRAEQGGLLMSFPAGRADSCRLIRFRVQAEGFDSLEIKDIRACPGGRELFPGALYSGDAQQSESGFYPFGERLLPGNCFYAACEDALSKPGAEVLLSFDLRFDKFPIEGYPPPYIHWKKVMKEAELLPPKEYEIKISRVIWEYYNGTGWASLPVLDGGDVFSQGSTGRYTLRFTAPGDIRPAICGAHEMRFIRARIIAADNLFRMYGYTLAPFISSPRFSYGYKTGVRVAHATVDENLELREVTLPGCEKVIKRPADGAALYLAFSGKFTQGALLFHLEESISAPPLRWEYHSPGGWAGLDIQDTTENLGKTGIITYQTSTPGTPAKIFGKYAYWMRLVDVESAYSGQIKRPRLCHIYENAVTATARSPGEASNLGARSMTSLTRPVAGVSSAFNPLPTYGGEPVEREEFVIERMTAAFSNCGRAVSANDCEQLALEASLQVCRARCYPNTDPAGSPAYGQTCLVILCRDIDADFMPVKRTVESYIAMRRPLGAGKLHVVQPRYVAVNITVGARVASPDEALAMKKGINETLARFLDPFLGGSDRRGWGIGELPSAEGISLALREVRGIVSISSIKVDYICAGLPVGRNRALREPFVLPVNGSHTVMLES